MRHLAPPRIRWGRLCAVVVLALCLWPAAARAHSTTFAVYSKYEATTSGRSVAFVFALDKPAPEALADHRGFFSTYLFQRFFVSNNGVACSHPEQLGRFFWDDPTKRVVAVTKFTCPDDLSQLTIRSLVTHDMPIPHEMVGDLQHGQSLERSFFAGDN